MCRMSFGLWPGSTTIVRPCSAASGLAAYAVDASRAQSSTSERRMARTSWTLRAALAGEDEPLDARQIGLRLRVEQPCLAEACERPRGVLRAELERQHPGRCEHHADLADQAVDQGASGVGR